MGITCWKCVAPDCKKYSSVWMDVYVCTVCKCVLIRYRESGFVRKYTPVEENNVP